MKNKKNFFINLGIIVGVIIFVLVVLYIKSLNCPNPSEKIVECIANNSVLYIQAGCHFCDVQEKEFGECYKLLNVIDCTENPLLCFNKEIQHTPTWIFNDTHIKGFYKIEELKEMMNC